MGDVLEYLIDGTSGLAPGGVEGSAIIAGVCSIGTVGKGYLLGKNSDLEGLLGVGPLVDRLRDVFATAGQDPVVIAVPVTGQSGAYISDLKHTGTGPDGSVSGVAAANADVVVKISTGGALGTCEAQVSEDGGETFGAAAAVASNGQITIGTTGTTLTLAVGTHVVDDTYAYAVRMAIGPVALTGTGPDITLAGTVKCAAQIVLLVVSAGGRNEATYQLSVDGGDNYGAVSTVPVDGVITCGSTGVAITVPETDLVVGDTYECDLLPPVPSITDVMTALETPLSLYDVEFIHVAGPSDSVDWAAMGAKADELWNLHRPTYFRAESRLPYADEDLNDWVAALIAERQGFAHRFVTVCTAHGEVVDAMGKSVVRNWAGLKSGRVISMPVMRAAGRVRDGGISQGTLPETYTTAMQKILENAGYDTAQFYAGLPSAYWGTAKTLAEVTSDFQREEVLRTVFKAVRKSRIAALKSMMDEAGDLVLGGDAAGLAYLKGNIESALDTMVAAVPQELAGYVVEIPDGQDIVNNGVAVIITLIGIPIIGEIKLYAQYVYAGSANDPRLDVAA